MNSVLIVDDEPLIVKGIRIMLERSPLPIDDIMEAENGEEGLSLALKKIPDVVITDIRMPVMDGLEFCRQLSRQFPQAGIVVISGYDDFHYAQEAMKSGVRNYLLKPVQCRELVETVGGLLREKYRHKAYISYREMDVAVGRLQDGIWYNLEEDMVSGRERILQLMEKQPIDYCCLFVREMCSNFLREFSTRLGYQLKMEIPDMPAANRQGLAAWLEAIVSAFCGQLAQRRANTDYNLFQMARRYLEEHYSEDIRLEDLAKKTGFSTGYFSRLFKTRVGKSFVQYKTEIRIRRAMEILCRRDKTVTSVAMAVGYNDVTYFIRAFKECTGMTPMEYRNKRGVGLCGS